MNVFGVLPLYHYIDNVSLSDGIYGIPIEFPSVSIIFPLFYL